MRPNLCIIKQSGKATIRYLPEVFDPNLPQYRVRSKLKAYVKYLTDNEWEGEDPEPIILLVLPSLYTLIYAKRKARKLLIDEYYEAKDQGITTNLWEEGRNIYPI